MCQFSIHLPSRQVFSWKSHRNEVVHKNKDKRPPNQKIPHRKAEAGVPRMKFLQYFSHAASPENNLLRLVQNRSLHEKFLQELNLTEHIETIITQLVTFEDKLVVDTKKIKQT